MPPAVGIGIALAGAGAQMIGQSKQASDQRRYLEQAAAQMSPGAILNRLATLNPQLYQAAYGQRAWMGGQQAPRNFSDWLDWESGMAGEAARNPLAALYQAPGHIDPRVLNASFQMAEAQGQQAQQQLGSMFGRSGYSGGLAAALTLANKGAVNQAKQGIFTNYLNQREALRRSDIELGQNILQQNINSATGQAQGAAGFLAQRQAGPNVFNFLGGLASTGLSAYGAYKGFKGGPPPTYHNPLMPTTTQTRTPWQDPLSQEPR